MSEKLKFAVIIGSTRDSRTGPVPAEWIASLARERPELDVEIVDLKAFELPLFNELSSNLWSPSQDARAVAWQRKIAEFDAYIVVTPEYNRSIPAALKNAFDQAYVEWGRKPIGFVGYGGVGAARAVEHARTIAVELQMAPVRAGVHIGGAEYRKLVHEKRPISEIEPALKVSAKEMLDQLIWWGAATKAARERQLEPA